MEKPGLVGGFKYPFRGLKFLFVHAGMLKYVMIPISINCVLSLVFLCIAILKMGWLIERFVPRVDAFYGEILFYILAFLLVVAVFLFTVCIAVLVGNIILSPFNELLSEKTEFIYTGIKNDAPFSVIAVIKDFSRSAKAELGRIGLFVFGFLALLLLNLVPVIGQAVNAVVAPLYTMFFLGWEYLDYSMERKRMTFGEKRKTVFKNAMPLLGFGAGTMLFLLIPFAGLLAIPVCVVGGSLLFCDLDKTGERALPENT